MLSRRSLVHLLLATSAVVLAWRLWPLPAPTAAPAAATEARTIPMTGAALEAAVDLADGEERIADGGILPPVVTPAGGCIEMLDVLVARKSWQFQVTDGGSGCFGDYVVRSYTVYSEGRIEWKELGRSRVFDLTERELATLRRLNRYDCIRKEEVGYGERYFLVSFGGDANDGATISASSSMGVALEKLLEGARERAASDWHTRTGNVRVVLDARSIEKARQLTPKTGVYHVELDGQRMTISRGKNVLATEYLGGPELMLLVEELERGRTDAPSDPADAIAAGTLTIGTGAPTELRFGWGSSEGPLAPLMNPVRNAIFKHEHPER